MNEDFTLRRATLDDVDSLVELRLALQSENGTNGVDWDEVAEACRSYFREAIPSGIFVVFVAEAQGQVIATSGLSFVSRPPGATSVSQSEGYITNMYTVPAWRGKGVATALLNANIEHAKRHRARLVFLHTSDAGRPLYEKLGFAEYPRYMELRLE